MFNARVCVFTAMLMAILATGQGNESRTISPPTNPNATWPHPSEIAKDCINSIGHSLVEKCQQKAEHDYDPARLNTTKSSVWETCCSLYEELDCYLHNAEDFCTDATRKRLVDYTKKVVIFFQDSLCHTVIQIGWRSFCDKMIHQAMAHHHDQDPDGPVKPDLIKLPTPAAGSSEAKCFAALRNSSSGDLEEKCLNVSMNTWDPKRNKLFDGNVQDSCCAYYSAMDCIIQESIHVCDNATEASAMAAYRANSFKKLSSTICKKVPSDDAHRLCSATGAAFASSLPSTVAVLLTLIVSALTFASL